VAKALYGNDWNKRVDDVPESFFFNYKEGAPLTTAAWPTGTYLRRIADSTLFFIDGASKRHIVPTTADAYRVNEDFVIRTGSSLSEYLDGSEPAAADRRYMDSAQLDMIETLPPPQLDLPPSSGELLAGQEQTLLTIRVVSGAQLKVKRLRASISGPLRSSMAPNLTDLKFVDASGTNLFGTNQLEGSVSREDLEISGSYYMPANSTSVIELKAKLSAGLAAGSLFTVAFDRSGVVLADGGNDEPLPGFFPHTVFPSSALTVK
jgi:hypothetical protein